jgi:hypothetical protein
MTAVGRGSDRLLQKKASLFDKSKKKLPAPMQKERLARLKDEIEGNSALRP